MVARPGGFDSLLAHSVFHNVKNVFNRKAKRFSLARKNRMGSVETPFETEPLEKISGKIFRNLLFGPVLLAKSACSASNEAEHPDFVGTASARRTGLRLF